MGDIRNYHIICKECNHEYTSNNIKYCEYCGSKRLYKEKLPSLIDRRDIDEIGDSNTEVYKWKTIAMLFVFPPIGIYYMWKNNVFTLTSRLIITVFDLILPILSYSSLFYLLM